MPHESTMTSQIRKDVDALQYQMERCIGDRIFKVLSPDELDELIDEIYEETVENGGLSELRRDLLRQQAASKMLSGWTHERLKSYLEDFDAIHADDILKKMVRNVIVGIIAQRRLGGHKVVFFDLEGPSLKITTLKPPHLVSWIA
jgi:hypothetical protein